MPGQGRGHLCLRPGNPGCFVQLQAAVGHPSLRYIKIKRRFDYVPFSRANIYARDDHRCQYCGDDFPTSELTFDHVLPVAHGGRKDWGNIVTCCVSCNRRKGGRTPGEAGMHLRRVPKRPDSAPAIRITVGLRSRRKAGATTSTGTSSSTTAREVSSLKSEHSSTLRLETCNLRLSGLAFSFSPPMPFPRVATVRPSRAIDGGRIAVHGSDFPVDHDQLRSSMLATSAPAWCSRRRRVWT